VVSALNEEGRKRNKKIAVHVKVDTGMGRIGIPIREALEFIRWVARQPFLDLEGLFTHFAAADEADAVYTRKQIEEFLHLLGELERKGIKIPLRHAGNSAAAMLFPQGHFDMIRLGISMYGYYPNPELSWPLHLQPVATWKTRLIYVKKVPAGFAISYGCTFITSRPTTVGTLPLGYADGYWRLLSNNGDVLVRGRKAPVIGRVCMDQTMVDLTGIPEAKEGDEVVLIGEQGGEVISADDLARQVGTISYEVLTSLGRRVPRIYFKGGRQVAMRTLLQEL